jgi:hypothetical protein
VLDDDLLKTIKSNAGLELAMSASQVKGVNLAAEDFRLPAPGVEGFYSSGDSAYTGPGTSLSELYAPPCSDRECR